MDKMKLADIAARILTHLKRFESDPAIADVITTSGKPITKFYKVNAWASGRYVGVRYVSFHPESNLTKQEALAYLAWLDAGNVGRHYEVKR